MASIARDAKGHRRIQFMHPDGRRPTIRLGKVSQRTAESIKHSVEQLIESLLYKQPADGDLARWVASLEPPMARKLAAAGLIAPPDGEPEVTLEPFLKDWLDGRKSDYKPASVRAWGQVIDGLVAFLGADCPIRRVTQENAEEYRQSMLAAGLRATTIHKRLQHARMIFAYAVQKKALLENPFEFVRHRPGDASERRAYVEVADVRRVIDHAPDNTWRLLIALSRFAGLRVPSEALSLRWGDIDWERGRVIVPVPKLEHLPGRGCRVIQLLADVRPYLEAAWDEAPEGAEYVFPDEYRRRAQGKDGWASANFRTTLQKIIKRAKILPWTRLWHSMRASCETDLAREYPLVVVAKWLGNTPAVAMRHYVDVTDAEFERAAAGGASPGKKAAQIPAQQVHAEARNGSPAELSAHKKAPAVRGLAATCDPLHNRGMEAAGIEPASRGGSAQTSTCVSGRFESRR